MTKRILLDAYKHPTVHLLNSTGDYFVIRAKVATALKKVKGVDGSVLAKQYLQEVDESDDIWDVTEDYVEVE
jgi:hypothetical protein